jgi:hypothetical protein
VSVETRGALSWIPAASIALGEHRDAPSWATALVRWMHEFVVRPHPALGRAGAVCPYLAPSLKRNLVFLTEGSPDVADAAGATDDLLTHLDQFIRHPPTCDVPDHSFKCLMVAYPRLQDRTTSLLTVARTRVKSAFVRSGTTCGEFYPTSEDRSVRSDALFVARAPVAAVAIRYLSPHDELFLKAQPALYALFLQWRRSRRSA